MNKFILLLFSILFSMTTYAGGNNKEIMSMIGMGWNLGNHFDTHSRRMVNPNDANTWWDRSITTEALYRSLAKAGLKSVRIPVTWGTWQGDAPGYVINEEFMKVIEQNVRWAKKAGLTVILNTHHDEYWLDAYAASSNDSINEAIKVRLVATWTQIADRFKNEGKYLILESFNELNHKWKQPTEGELRIQNEWNQIVVDVIRKTGGYNAKRWISVPSYHASPIHALDDRFQLPDDPAHHLIMAVHCYDPYEFTLKAADKSHDADLARTTWGTDADKVAITNLFARLKKKFIDNVIPCYLGEYGCSIHKTEEGNKCRDEYLKFFCQAARDACLPGCIWDNDNPGKGSEHHSYFSHSDGRYLENQEAIIKSMVDIFNLR